MSNLRRFLVGLSLAMAIAPAFSIEFGADGQLSNLQFLAANTKLTTGSFPSSNYVWGGSAFFNLPLGEDAGLRLSYERDPVLRNVGTASVEFERGIARVSVGPFFGFGFGFGDDQPFSAGLSTSIRFQWPGVAYASVRSDGAIAIGLAGVSSDPPQARAEIAAGFYTRHAIVSAIISASQFSETVDSKPIMDSLASYMLTIDLFKKNVPYTLLMEAGYQMRSKCYDTSVATADLADVTEILGSVILGISATVQPLTGIKVIGSLESSVFAYGSEALANRSPSSEAFLFTAKFGISVDTDALPKNPLAKKAAKR